MMDEDDLTKLMKLFLWVARRASRSRPLLNFRSETETMSDDSDTYASSDTIQIHTSALSAGQSREQTKHNITQQAKQLYIKPTE